MRPFSAHTSPRGTCSPDVMWAHESPCARAPPLLAGEGQKLCYQTKVTGLQAAQSWLVLWAVAAASDSGAQLPVAADNSFIRPTRGAAPPHPHAVLCVPVLRQVSCTWPDAGEDETGSHGAWQRCEPASVAPSQLCPPVEFVPLTPSAWAGIPHPGWPLAAVPPSGSRNNGSVGFPP